MRSLGIWTILLAAGCLTRPSSSAMHDGGHGNGSDAAKGSDAVTGADASSSVLDAPANPLGCLAGNLHVFDDFDGSGVGSAACPGGTVMTNGATVRQTGGNLVFTPNAMTSSADCLYNPFPDNIGAPIAVIVHVSSALQGIADATYAQMFAGTDSVKFVLTNNGHQLKFYNAAGMPDTGTSAAVLPMYWRFTFDDAKHVSAAYSVDGTDWSQFVTGTQVAGGNVQLMIGITSASGDPSPSAFEGLYYCR